MDDDMPRCERCGLELEGYECPVHGCRTTPDPYAELESCPVRGPVACREVFALAVLVAAVVGMVLCALLSR